MDVLRHGAMDVLLGGVRALSTLGSHLRSYTWGNVSHWRRQAREFLAELARRAPLLPGAETLAFIDIDSMREREPATRSRARGLGTQRSRGSRCWSGA